MTTKIAVTQMKTPKNPRPNLTFQVRLDKRHEK